MRKQKLMAAGKVVSGRPGTLATAGLRPGAKLMLLAGAGGPTAGQAALEASRQSRQEALERGRQQLAERAAQKGVSAGAAGALTPASMRQRAEAWQKTGIAALRDLQLAELPAELFAAQVASSLRVLDAGGNALAALPPTLGQLMGLQRLRLSLNRLTDEGAAWPVLAKLTQLFVLAVDDNRLTALPPAISSLGRLQKLSLNGNQIGGLTGLRVLGIQWPRPMCSCRQHAVLNGSCMAAVPRLRCAHHPFAMCTIHFAKAVAAHRISGSHLLPHPQPLCPTASARCSSCVRWRCGATAWPPCLPAWAPAPLSWRLT